MFLQMVLMMCDSQHENNETHYNILHHSKEIICPSPSSSSSPPSLSHLYLELISAANDCLTAHSKAYVIAVAARRHEGLAEKRLPHVLLLYIYTYI